MQSTPAALCPTAGKGGHHVTEDDREDLIDQLVNVTHSVGDPRANRNDVCLTCVMARIAPETMINFPTRTHAGE